MVLSRSFLARYFLALMPFTLMTKMTMAAPLFMAPNGLAPDTPIGDERLNDGSPRVTLRTLVDATSQNQHDIQALASQGVTHDAMTRALEPYLTIMQAQTQFATSSDIGTAIQREADRAVTAENDLNSRVQALQNGKASLDQLNAALAPYMTTEAGNTISATQAALTDSIRMERERAIASENAISGQVSAMQGAMITRAILTEALTPYISNETAIRSYVSQSSFATAMATKLNSTDAGKTYLPLAGGTMTGPISGGYFMPACYSIADLKSLPRPAGLGIACYYDVNNNMLPNLAVYALGAWRWLNLGNVL